MSAERWIGSRQRWSGSRARAEPAAPEARVAARRAFASSTSCGDGEPLRPGERAVGLLALLEHVAGPHAVALDPERHVGLQPDRLPAAGGVGRVPVVADQRPVGGRAPVVEDRLADQLDLDLAVEAEHRAHEHVVAVVVGRRPRVRRDHVLAVLRAHRQRVAHEDPAGGRLPGRGEDVGPRLVDRAPSAR